MHDTPTADSSHSGGGRQPWTILVLLAVAQFMVILDVTVVNVALPSIQADLGFAPGDLQWVVTAYVLFSGGLLMLGGRAADLLGRRSVFLAGLAVFTLASLVSGLASSPGMLIGSRAAQGLGAAMLSPAALSLVTSTYTGPQRTTALSAWGGIAAAGSVVGLVIGGMLTTWLSWEWIFFINVPIGLVAIPLTLHLVPAPASNGSRSRAPSHDGGLRQLDIAGAVALVAGLASLIYGVQGTSSHGWASAHTLGLFGMTAALLASFIRIEGIAARPLVPLTTWRIRSLSSGVAMMFGATGFMVGLIYLSSLYLQGPLGFSALEAGFAFVPLMLTVGIAAHLAPHLLRGLGTKTTLSAGLLVMAAGAGLLAAAPDRATYASDLLPWFVVIGAGIGLVFVSIQVAAMSEVEEQMAGLASGLFTTGHEIGAAFGVAVLGSVGSFGGGITVAAVAAAAMALLAALAVPSFRPARTAHVGAH